MTCKLSWPIAIFVSSIAVASVHAQPASELIAQAIRPLPEDLRADATVFTYDADTGERIVLRQGTNQVECRPRNPETGYTRCFPVVDAPRRDLVARLAAQGMSEDEQAAAMAAALADGTVTLRPFGSLSYRLYEEDDRIQLLWMVALPNAVSDDLGMPTGSQRDSSLAGRGTPWMMLEDSPGAHLMIPINGTELSN